jgi:hypothetical protein
LVLSFFVFFISFVVSSHQTGYLVFSDFYVVLSFGDSIVNITIVVPRRSPGLWWLASGGGTIKVSQAEYMASTTAQAGLLKATKPLGFYSNICAPEGV